MSTIDEDDYDLELRELKRLSKENNEILKFLKKKSQQASFFSALKWIIYICIAIGLFTFVKPFLDNILKTYSVIQENMQSVDEIRNNAVIDINNIDFNKLSEFLKKP
jgi:hypothetical protein